MGIKSIIISAKLAFLISIILIASLFVLPRDSYGYICGNGAIKFFILLLIVIFLILAVIDLIRKKFYILSFLIVLILLFLLFIIVFASVDSVSARALGAATKAEMSRLRAAQDMFYWENHRYADTQEELIDAELIDRKFENRITEKELTDRDGEGTEGGDNDPETWSVTAYIPYREIGTWCRLISEGYWFTCNQNGCYDEK